MRIGSALPVYVMAACTVVHVLVIRGDKASEVSIAGPTRQNSLYNNAEIAYWNLEKAVAKANHHAALALDLLAFRFRSLYLLTRST